MNYKLMVFIPITLSLLSQADPMGKKGADAFNKGLEKNIEKIEKVVDSFGYKTMDGIGRYFKETTQENLPLIIAAGVAIKSSQWAYNRFFPSSEEQAKRAAVNFMDCLKANTEGPRNIHGIPSECTYHAFSFALAREKLAAPHSGLPRTKEIIDAFQHYHTPSP